MIEVTYVKLGNRYLIAEPNGKTTVKTDQELEKYLKEKNYKLV